MGQTMSKGMTVKRSAGHDIPGRTGFVLEKNGKVHSVLSQGEWNYLRHQMIGTVSLDFDYVDTKNADLTVAYFSNSGNTYRVYPV